LSDLAANLGLVW